MRPLTSPELKPDGIYVDGTLGEQDTTEVCKKLSAREIVAYRSTTVPIHCMAGQTGYTRIWNAVQPNESTVIFNYICQTAKGNFPGNLEVEMTYRLEDETNALVIKI